MKRETFTSYYFIKKHKPLKNGSVPVFLRVTVNGKRWEKGLNVSINPDHWDSKKEKAIQQGSNPSHIVNETINSTNFKLQKIRIKNENEGTILTLSAIIEELSGIKKLNRTIIKLFERHNEQIKEKIGIWITEATYERYITCYKHFKKFINVKYKYDDLPVSEINKDLFDDFYMFLRKDKKCAHNTSVVTNQWGSI